MRCFDVRTTCSRDHFGRLAFLSTGIHRVWRTATQVCYQRGRSKPKAKKAAYLPVRGLFSFVVREAGLEPAHPCGRQDLNLVRLPISPLTQASLRFAGSTAADLRPPVYRETSPPPPNHRSRGTASVPAGRSREACGLAGLPTLPLPCEPHGPRAITAITAITDNAPGDSRLRALLCEARYGDRRAPESVSARF